MTLADFLDSEAIAQLRPPNHDRGCFMRSLLRSIAIAILLALSLQQPAHGGEAKPTVACSVAAQDLRVAMRMLWEDHVSYTRNVVTSMISNLPDQQIVTERLLRNQADIGYAVKPFYGPAAGDALANLLKEHIVIAATVVKAAKAGNQSDLADAKSKWEANGRELAGFLSHANPHWNRSTLDQMLHMHLDFLTRQVMARLHQDWTADIRAYDEGEAHMMMFADVLTQGLVEQFPERFR